MTTYTFLYTDLSGEVVRWTAMQCDSDAEALHKARDTMQDKYEVLKVFHGERLVHSLITAEG